MEEQAQEKEIRRLYRSRKDRLIGGVCGGIAEYFEIDPTIVRIVWVLLIFAKGIGLLAYLIGLIIIPENPARGEVEKVPSKRTSRSLGIIFGIVLILLGFYFLSEQLYWFPYRWRFFWPWYMRWDLFWPLLLILIGVLYLISIRRKESAGGVEAEGKQAEEVGGKPEGRKLFRSRTDRKMAGVCGGLGEYFSVDPTWVRLGWVFFTIFTGFWLGILVYVIMAIAVPEARSPGVQKPES